MPVSILPPSRMVGYSNVLELTMGSTAMASYMITELDPAQKYSFRAYAINNEGVVAGLYFPPNNPYWLPMRYKGTLEPLPLPSWAGGGLGGINNSSPEQIVGHVNDRAALWTGGQYTDLHPLLEGPSSHANDINDSGIVVGTDSGEIGDFSTVAYQLDTNTQQVERLLHEGEKASTAIAINTQGNIVGITANASDGKVRPFIYDGTVHVLSGLEKVSGSIYINDNNIVAGSTWRAFLYDHNTAQITDIHDPGFATTAPLGINNDEVIVGMGNQEVSRGLLPNFAVIWEPGKPMRKLSDLVVNLGGRNLDYAMDINDEGQIICVDYIQERSYLLTPTPKYFTKLHLPTLVAQTIVGLLAGGSGFIFLPGSGVVPVDPAPFQQWAEFSPSERDVLMGLAIHEFASLVGDAEARRRIEVSGLETIKTAVDQLLTDAKEQAGNQDATD